MNENKSAWRPHFEGVDPDEQFPRALVGIYLKDQYERIKRLAFDPNITIEEKFNEVVYRDWKRK